MKQPKEYAWEPHKGGTELRYVRVEDGWNCGKVEKRGARWMAHCRNPRERLGTVSQHQTEQWAKRAVERAWHGK